MNTLTLFRLIAWAAAIFNAATAALVLVYLCRPRDGKKPTPTSVLLRAAGLDEDRFDGAIGRSNDLAALAHQGSLETASPEVERDDVAGAAQLLSRPIRARRPVLTLGWSLIAGSS